MSNIVKSSLDKGLTGASAYVYTDNDIVLVKNYNKFSV